MPSWFLRIFGLERRVSVLEDWVQHHERELGSGGAAQRIQELERLRYQVEQLLDTMKRHEDDITQVMQVGNDNLNTILAAIRSMEEGVKHSLEPVINSYRRLEGRLHTLEIRSYGEFE